MPLVVHYWADLQSVFVSDIAIFVLKRDVKLQLTNLQSVHGLHCCGNIRRTLVTNANTKC